MSIGYLYSTNEEMIAKALDKHIKALNRPDILIEESKATTQSFQEFVRKRKKTGEDKSIDLFDPLSQSNNNLKNINDLDDVIIPDRVSEQEDLSNASRYRHIFN